MAEELGTVRGSIVLDIRDALNAYTKVRQEHLSTVSALGAGAGALTAVGASFTAMGAAAAAGILVSINAAADFERKLDYFIAVSGPDAANMYDAIAEKALQLGADTIYSADQIADSFVELGKSGVAAQDIIDGIGEGVASLGAAADIPLDTAANIITAAVATFGLGADRAVAVADKLAGAANASIVDVQDLGVSLKYAGGVASSLGVPFEDLNTAFAILGVNGIKGSTAGTSMRQVLLSLNGTTAKARKALTGLGIITEDGTNKFYNMDGSAKSLSEVFQILQNATRGMTDEQRTATMQQIFATRALPSLIALTKAGADGFAEMAGEINKVTALEVANARLDNLSGDLEILRGNFDTLMISVGMTQQSLARGLVQSLIAVFNWLNELDPVILGIIAGFAQFAAVAALILGILGLVSGAVLNVIAMAERLAPAIGFLSEVFAKFRAGTFVTTLTSIATGPIGVIITLIAGLVSAFIWFFSSTEEGMAAWAEISGIFIEAFHSMMPAFAALAEAFTTLTATAGPALASLIPIIVDGLIAALVALVPAVVVLAEVLANSLLIAVNIVVPVLTFLVDLLSGPLGGILLGLAAAVVAVVAAIKIWTAVQWLLNAAMTANPIGIIIMAIAALVAAIIWVATQTTFFQDTWATVSQWFIEVWTNVSNFFITLWTGIVEFFTGVWEAIVAFLTPIFEVIAGIIRFHIEMWINIFLVLAAVLVTIWNAIVAVVTTVWNAIVAFITPIVQKISSVISTAIGIVRQVWTNIWNAISSFFKGIWNGIIGFLTPIINRVVSNIRGPVQQIQGTWNTIWSAISTFFSNIWNAIVNAVTNAVSRVVSVVRGIYNKVMGAFSGAVSWLFNIGKDIIQGLINGITSMFSGIVDAISNVVNGAISWAKDVLGIKSPSRVFMAIGNDTIQGMINGILGMAPSLSRTMDMVGSSVDEFYDQVYAAREMDVMLDLAAQMGVDDRSTQSKIAALNETLAEIAAKDTYNVEKIEVNNPEAEPASESLPNAIRKTAYMVGAE